MTMYWNSNILGGLPQQDAWGNPLSKAQAPSLSGLAPSVAVDEFGTPMWNTLSYSPILGDTQGFFRNLGNNTAEDFAPNVAGATLGSQWAPYVGYDGPQRYNVNLGNDWVRTFIPDLAANQARNDANSDQSVSDILKFVGAAAGMYGLGNLATNVATNGLGSIGFGANAPTATAAATSGAIPVSSVAGEIFGIPEIAGASDGIEALNSIMNVTGAQTAGQAASMLGYASPEAMLGAINPAWVGASAAGGSWLGNLLKGGASAASSGGSGSGGLGTALGGMLGGSGSNLAGLGALAGGLLSGSSLGQSRQAGTTTTTNVPWEPMQPYLMGLAADAQSLYKRNMGTPQTMTNIANLATQNAMGYQDLSGMGRDMAYQANSGMFDPVLGYVNDVSARGGFASMGDLDPSGAYARMLSGQISPYVDQQAKAITDQANQNLSLNVMPSIRSGAQSAGQYGSSRQGIAEGVAAGLSNQGVTNSLANLYGNAWNTAQAQMGNAASQLGQMGNANQQYNAQLGLNRNAQNMSAAQQALGARQTGMNLGTSSYGLGNGALTDAYNLQNNLNQYPWQNVKNYQGVVAPLAGMGGSQSTPYYTNQASNILGGALAGYKLFGG